MKALSKWEVTSFTNQELQKVVRRKISRELFLKILRESQKYSVLQRVASELFRAGVTPQYFLRVLHKDDWTMSTRVMEELERIHKGRNGYDPDKVPPLLPIYLKRIEGEDAIQTKGRPTRQYASTFVLKTIKDLLLKGWSEGDVVRGFYDVLDSLEDDTKVVRVKELTDCEEAKPKATTGRRVTKIKYYVHTGFDWERYESPKKATEALERLKNEVVGNIRRAEPMPDITARICNECKQPLTGDVITLRGEKKGRKRSVIEHLHHNCFWLKRVEPCRIPLNMELLCPSDGKTYVWCSPEKGGWRLKNEIKALVPAGSPVGVSGPPSEQPPAVVPTTPAT